MDYMFSQFQRRIRFNCTIYILYTCSIKKFEIVDYRIYVHNLGTIYYNYVFVLQQTGCTY